MLNLERYVSHRYAPMCFGSFKVPAIEPRTSTLSYVSPKRNRYTCIINIELYKLLSSIGLEKEEYWAFTIIYWKANICILKQGSVSHTSTLSSIEGHSLRPTQEQSLVFLTRIYHRDRLSASRYRLHWGSVASRYVWFLPISFIYIASITGPCFNQHFSRSNW